MSGYSESSVFAVIPTEGVVARLWSPPVGGNSISWGSSAPWSGPYSWGGVSSATTMMWGGSQQWGSRGSYGGTSPAVAAGNFKTSIFTTVRV
jgi:hypothetical protein